MSKEIRTLIDAAKKTLRWLPAAEYNSMSERAGRELYEANIAAEAWVVATEQRQKECDHVRGMDAYELGGGSREVDFTFCPDCGKRLSEEVKP
jgi:hypothetical protein